MQIEVANVRAKTKNVCEKGKKKVSSFLALFWSKIRKILHMVKNKQTNKHKQQQKSVPRHVSFHDFQVIWTWLNQNLFSSLFEKF